MGRTKLLLCSRHGLESAPVARSGIAGAGLFLLCCGATAGRACARGDSAGTPDLDRGPQFWLLSRCYVLCASPGRPGTEVCEPHRKGPGGAGVEGEYYSGTLLFNRRMTLKNEALVTSQPTAQTRTAC